MNKYVVVFNDRVYPLQHMIASEFDSELKPSNVCGIPAYYKEEGGCIYVWPRILENSGIEVFVLQKVTLL